MVTLLDATKKKQQRDIIIEQKKVAWSKWRSCAEHCTTALPMTSILLKFESQKSASVNRTLFSCPSNY